MATNDRIDLLFSKMRKNINPNVEVVIPKPIIEKPEGDDIGKQIAYYRKIQGRTQKEICKKLGINRSTMNMYETKPIKLVNVKILKMIFKELNIENKIVLPDYEKFIFNNQAEKMQKLLKENNLTSYQFAKIVGVDDCNVRKWMLGKSVMSRASFNKIKEKFNV